jgi:predicted Zn-dependent protease with MMP-like domain
MMTNGDFERLVAQALDDIPAEFARHLDNVAVVIEDEPTPAMLRDLGLDPAHDTLFGLYRGVPLSRRPHALAALPDHITIFRAPLLRICRSPAAIERQIKVTIVHEIAHYFGLDEHRIRRLGY